MTAADTPDRELPAGDLQEDYSLPALRDDIQVFPGGRTWKGERSWTVYDPLRNRFFQLTDTDFHLFSCWGAGTPEAIASRVYAEYGYTPRHEDIEDFFSFLVSGELVIAGTTGLRRRLTRIALAIDGRPAWERLLHTYLSFRIPLLRPDRLLERVYPRVRFLFTRTFIVSGLLVGLVGLYLTLRQWGTFVETFPRLLDLQGLLSFVAALVVVKILHEFGHALLSKHFGLRVPTMGIAFIVMWPILYTDSTDAWRLKSSRKRALISAAGVLAESFLVCYALFFWAILPAGPARDTAFAIITVIWIGSVLVNLNPIVKFDGYYFISDLLNIPNLQDRSFALARWKVRQWILGVERDPPEDFPAPLRRFLVGFAFFVWIYRFFLFLGIALLVYHFFFKLLGIFLFLVEMWWFIVRPVWNEVKSWRSFSGEISLTRRRSWLAGFAVLLLLLAVPWRNDLLIPARLVDSDYFRAVTTRDVRVGAVRVADGQSVQRGDVLVVLESDELADEILMARLDIEFARVRLNTAAASAGSGFDDRLVMDGGLELAESKLDALMREQELLVVRAPFDGSVRDLLPNLHAGRWFSRGTPILSVVGGRAYVVEALVAEENSAGIVRGSTATFYPEMAHAEGRYPLKVDEVEYVVVSSIESPYLADAYGGEIAVASPDSLVPREALFRIWLSSEGADSPSTPPVALRGWVRVEGGRRSVLWLGLRRMIAMLVREMGF